jgi:hypothetical protein
METIDPIILGDNQFFGVNHMSQDRGKETYEKFKQMDEVKNILYRALDNGVKGVFFSTHPSIYRITDLIRNDPQLMDNLNIYVNVPYIYKYVQMLTENGLIQTLKNSLAGILFTENIKYFSRLAINIVTRDFFSIANRLIDMEMAPFYNLNVKAVFLHNALTDLALGYKLDNVISNFVDYIKGKYKLIPAFGTLNYPLFCEQLNRAGIGPALIMTAVNKKGFLMNPSREACEKAFRNEKHTVLAMGTLASGCIPPKEAYEYLFSLNSIRHVVVGLSSREHASETFGILRSHLSPD